MSTWLKSAAGWCREAKKVVQPAGVVPGGLASCPETEGESNYDVDFDDPRQSAIHDPVCSFARQVAYWKMQPLADSKDFL